MTKNKMLGMTGEAGDHWSTLQKTITKVCFFTLDLFSSVMLSKRSAVETSRRSRIKKTARPNPRGGKAVYQKSSVAGKKKKARERRKTKKTKQTYKRVSFVFLYNKNAFR